MLREGRVISLHYGYACLPRGPDQGLSYGFRPDGAKHRFEAYPHRSHIFLAIFHRPMFQ